MRQIILDTETTGLVAEEGHRIIEVGCLEMINRKLTGKNFHYYVNPEREIDREAIQVHGLSTDFLADKPLFAHIVTEFIQFVEGAELIIHNAPFDVSFINHEFKLCGLNKLITDYCSVVDTLSIARRKHPGQHNNLDALCRRYQVDNTNRELHGALIDTELLAKVYLAMTGGQTQLFQDNDHEHIQIEIKNKVQKEKTSSQRVSLTIRYPTSQELEQHTQYLADMKKTGNCLWMEPSD